MATGGLGGLNSQRIYPIKDKEIIVFPDYGQYEYWKQKAEMINLELGSNVMVSKTFEDIAKKEGLEMGCDIADYYLATYDSNNMKKEISETKKEFTQTKKESSETA